MPGKSAPGGAVKTFVLDTNVLLHSSQSLESFADNDVVIPMTVIEELDKFKKNTDELGRNARRVIRSIDRLRELNFDPPGQLRTGVKLQQLFPSASGRLFVLGLSDFEQTADFVRLAGKSVSGEMSLDIPDNRILLVAKLLSLSGRRVVFISKDLNLRLKADAIGLRVMDFERGKVPSDTLYSGFENLTLESAALERLYRDHQLPLPESSLLDNEFAVISSLDNPKQSALARFDRREKCLRLLERRADGVWNIQARNKEQHMALDLLLDPNIQLVTLVGGAGTGKTLLALAAALHAVLNEQRYERILVSRPIVPLGNDIGYLPGSKESKLSGWMQPIFDNLNLLLDSEREKKPHSSSRYSVESLQHARKLELEALTYIRGRSISRQFVIIDEAQNLTPHEVKTIISRCGNETKMVLTGDPHQIDNPYLDASGNGLCYAAERMKGEAIFGHITLSRSERGELASLAARLL